MRVLVTGASGAIGWCVTASLESRGIETVRYDLNQSSSLPPQDICDRAELERAMEGVDGVIHLAAISRVVWAETRPDLCQRINVEGTRTLLSVLTRHINKPWLIFASSREVYGNPADLPVDENAVAQPTNTYGRSKAEGERLVEQAHTLGLRAAILRFSSVYGSARDHPDRAAPALVWRAICGDELQITGADRPFDFVHVDDTVEGILATVESLRAGWAVPTVHLATGVGATLWDLATLAVEIAGTSAPIRVHPPRPFDVDGFVGDPTRAKATLGWIPRVTLRDGISALCADLRAHGQPPAAAIPDPAILFQGPAGIAQ
jgi:nucleoside-diphosphate-sugar epimerase